MVPVFWPTEVKELRGVRAARSRAERRSDAGGLGAEDGQQQLLSACASESGTLRPRSSNINRSPSTATVGYGPLLVASPKQLQLSSVDLLTHDVITHAAYVPSACVAARVVLAVRIRICFNKALF